MSDQEIEKEIQAKGKTAPRLTPADIDAVIAAEEYHVFGGRMTICVLTLKNGFLVSGESSSVSAENFDVEIGRKIARENAREKIWLLEGYLLRDRLAAAE
ncbi:Gp49 family protein [Martelella mediterranea]|uniref:N4 Gp49/Sf6 Gp66 family protein n=1 Tax=Martelella mediterranea TaxID=293089 RepID=A0A4R3NIT2_9HYPH|nr:Gp49 family protein [Martelella mediterranea]TCT34631.1 N4 Gp49/Sf6 Gp66 family protein [Martelella mediterranea]